MEKAIMVEITFEEKNLKSQTVAVQSHCSWAKSWNEAKRVLRRAAKKFNYIRGDCYLFYVDYSQYGKDSPVCHLKKSYSQPKTYKPKLSR